MRLAEQVRLGELLDFYGGCLTATQLEVCRKYVCFNATLEEIAIQNGTTRQAVGDVLRRSIRKLEGMEASLGLVVKFHAVLTQIDAVAASVASDKAQARRIASEFTQLFKTLED